MASTERESEEHLFISYRGLTGSQPISVDTGDRHPVSLFGGFHHTTAIDNEGEVIFIHKKSHSILSHTRVESSSLPFNEKAASVACCRYSVSVLGLSVRVFMSDASSSNKLTFSTVSEFVSIETACLSGTQSHFKAVSRDCHFFSRGGNSYGQLGLGGTESTSEFREISSLGSHEITAAYAGNCHSLFQTAVGKILACGHNGHGELLRQRSKQRQQQQQQCLHTL